ncbi:MAG: thioredoxin fold domain-containing protein [Burkholderiales bacterium]|nr:thioredoxin fold domain-containing protein [Burkholderiales bacterium]
MKGQLVRSLRVALCALALGLAAGAAQARDPIDHFFQPFLGDLKAELAEAQAAGKKGVMIMYHFEGCPACEWMKANILSREDVQAFYRARFQLLAIDTLGALPITDFTGREWTEKAFARSIPIVGTPTFVFYGLDGEPLARHVGKVADPAEFMLLGEFVASGAHRRQSFAEYKSRNQRQTRKGI